MPDKLCALCGEVILEKPPNDQQSLTMEHVPTKQFHPKSMRPEIRGELWKVPTHKKCNNGVKLDEEYFYTRFYPLVGAQNEEMGKLVLGDIRRQAAKPQVRRMIRRLLKETVSKTPAGIVLPPTLVRVEYDVWRVQNVFVKTAQCLYYKDHERYLPRKNCDHCEIIEHPDQMQELFSSLIRHTERRAVVPSVFAYWNAEFERQQLYAMLYWGAVMVCMMFWDPSKSQDASLPEPSPQTDEGGGHANSAGPEGD